MNKTLQTDMKAPVSAYTPIKSSFLQRKCSLCKDDDKNERLNLQREAERKTTLGIPPIVHEVLRSPGEPLDADTRAFMEPRFGHDFNRVRVHADARAQESARAVKATAYTVGRDIVFGGRQFAPSTDHGQKLIAHELTHVIQQTDNSGIPKYPDRGDPIVLETTGQEDASEHEARDASNAVMRGESVASLSGKSLHIAMEQEQSATQPAQPPPNCGPDVTDWFVNIMNDAKRDSRTLSIQADLASARRTGAPAGFSSMDVLEGGVARRVLGAERAAGSPPRTADATSQIAGADPHNQFGRALLQATAPIPFVGMRAQAMFLLLKRAGDAWTNVVRTGGVWDFKNNILSGSQLTAASCQNQCSNPPTVTLCGTCYEHDLPGNLFYAYIGGFCGFSCNALQLGSQYAELQPDSSRNWDPPEDTAAINLGFSLPTALTRANLCAALQRAGSSVTIRPCPACSATYPIRRGNP